MSDDQVSMSDVARNLEVTLSAVSNWRRRHPSFPSAEEVNGQELFMVGELADWLDGRKISKKDLKPGELPGSTYGTRFRTAMRIEPVSNDAIDDALWRELARFRGAEDVAVFADLVLGLLYLAMSDDRCWIDIVATDGVQCLQLVERAALDHRPALRDLHRARGVFLDDLRGEARLVGIIRVVERIRQAARGPEVFEFLLDQFAAAEGRRGAAVHTPSAVVRLLVELVAPVPGRSVFDPCCGSGGFLVGAAKYLAARAGRVLDSSFSGHALSERDASLARMNLRLHGVSADVDRRSDITFRGDEMLIANERFDVVLSNPPFDLREPTRSGPALELQGRYGSLPKSRTNFAWLQYVISSLADDGRAAVVMPGGTLFRGGLEKQVRANMVDDGVVESIIALPSQMFISTGVPVTVWMLRPPAARPAGEILLVDASDLGQMISRTQRSLSDGDQARIVDTITRWRAGSGYEDVRGFSASVAVQRIREQEYVLTPARYVGTSVELNTRLRSVRELRYDLLELESRAAMVNSMVNQQLDGIWSWIH